MNRRCSQQSCFVHEGEACALGKMNVADCQSWAGDTPIGEGETTSPEPTSARVHWSGSALGLADLANLTPRGRSILVGVLGSHDAGKTMLLTGNYLRLLRGQTLADARFAGSRSLGAWESLAAWTRFDDAARLPSFPPHTSRNAGRIPGLLHLALRNASGAFRDVLLTDAPGEWFTRWAIKAETPEAEGSRWIARHADCFLVFADCQRLAGNERGPARNELRQLLERLGNHVDQRPTVLVWAKSDQVPNETIRAAIRRTLQEQIPHAVEVETTTNQPDSLALALEAALMPAWTGQTAKPIVEPVVQHQPFAAFRGSYAHA
jgi:hypothetical protein